MLIIANRATFTPAGELATIFDPAVNADKVFSPSEAVVVLALYGDLVRLPHFMQQHLIVLRDPPVDSMFKPLSTSQWEEGVATAVMDGFTAMTLAQAQRHFEQLRSARVELNARHAALGSPGEFVAADGWALAIEEQDPATIDTSVREDTKRVARALGVDTSARHDLDPADSGEVDDASF